MNSRPTVYEGLANINEIIDLTRLQAHQWAYEALAELGRGGHKIAGTLLAEMTAFGYPGADAALAEVAAGRWATAIALFRPLAQRVAASRSVEQSV